MVKRISLLEKEDNEVGEERVSSIIQSRFGAVEIYEENTYYFASGLLGMPEDFCFNVAEMPHPRHRHFKLLQSIALRDLSFIVTPLSLHNGLIDKGDIEKACLYASILPVHVSLLLITSIYKDEDKCNITVNLQAPILLDTMHKKGVQHVFLHNKYPLKHLIQ